MKAYIIYLFWHKNLVCCPFPCKSDQQCRHGSNYNHKALVEFKSDDINSVYSAQNWIIISGKWKNNFNEYYPAKGKQTLAKCAHIVCAHMLHMIIAGNNKQIGLIFGATSLVEVHVI